MRRVGERETNVSHLDVTQRGTCQTESKATAHDRVTLEKELTWVVNGGRMVIRKG